eukprot:TRINITY_DN94062_c0_g1_i1.p1 TRINITY_DN94062_c0_g1~~TRINITY_DN94062_c0_g1_i1.p1  ORF type:complete len:384 (+),score=44.85 TRINITY_DN94062_c0_g1_i1:34-1185(+)
MSATCDEETEEVPAAKRRGRAATPWRQLGVVDAPIDFFGRPRDFHSALLFDPDLPLSAVQQFHQQEHSDSVTIRPIVDTSHPLRGERGVFALHQIAAGTLLFPYAGLVGPHKVGRYVAELCCGWAVDAESAGNESRFINDWHGIAKAPNCRFEEQRCPKTGKYLVVVRCVTEVPAGKELLIDYGRGFWKGNHGSSSPTSPVSAEPDSPLPRATKRRRLALEDIRSALDTPQQSNEDGWPSDVQYLSGWKYCIKPEEQRAVHTFVKMRNVVVRTLPSGAHALVVTQDLETDAYIGVFAGTVCSDIKKIASPAFRLLLRGSQLFVTNCCNEAQFIRFERSGNVKIVASQDSFCGEPVLEVRVGKNPIQRGTELSFSSRDFLHPEK